MVSSLSCFLGNRMINLKPWILRLVVVAASTTSPFSTPTSPLHIHSLLIISCLCHFISSHFFRTLATNMWSEVPWVIQYIAMQNLLMPSLCHVFLSYDSNSVLTSATKWFHGNCYRVDASIFARDKNLFAHSLPFPRVPLLPAIHVVILLILHHARLDGKMAMSENMVSIGQVWVKKTLVKNLNFQLLFRSVSENIRTYIISWTEKNGLPHSKSRFERLLVKRLELDELMNKQSRQPKNKTFFGQIWNSWLHQCLANMVAGWWEHVITINREKNDKR